MANYVYNRVQAPKKVLKDLIDANGEVTFNKLVPEPLGIDYIEDLLCKEPNQTILPDNVSHKDEFKTLLKCYMDNKFTLLRAFYTNTFKGDTSNYPTFESYKKAVLDFYPMTAILLGTDMYTKYGCFDWYSWRCDNWGCKNVYASDNLYEFDDSDDIDTIEFDTPWSPPEGVIKALCEKYPTESILWHCDEESCLFSYDYEPDGSGYYICSDVFPEYYTPYLGDEESIMDIIDDRSTVEGVKTSIIEAYTYEPLDMEPPVEFKEQNNPDGTVDLEITMYDWPESGGDLLYTCTKKGLKK